MIENLLITFTLIINKFIVFLNFFLYLIWNNRSVPFKIINYLIMFDGMVKAVFIKINSFQFFLTNFTLNFNLTIWRKLAFKFYMIIDMFQFYWLLIATIFGIGAFQILLIQKTLNSLRFFATFDMSSASRTCLFDINSSINAVLAKYMSTF